MLYTIFVVPLFDISKLSNLADDNFALAENETKETCIKTMEFKTSSNHYLAKGVQIISKLFAFFT